VESSRFNEITPHAFAGPFATPTSPTGGTATIGTSSSHPTPTCSLVDGLTSLRNLEWRAPHVRIALLITDQPCHGTDYRAPTVHAVDPLPKGEAKTTPEAMVHPISNSFIGFDSALNPFFGC
jgi:hypothetical protein